MTRIIKVTGLDELHKFVVEYPETALPFIEQAMHRVTLLLTGYMQNQPEASEANRPRSAWQSPQGRSRDPNRWYQRGYGPKWIDHNNIVHGERTSERLVENWTNRVTVSQTGGGPIVKGVAGNRVSYVDEVQGDRQQPWHRKRGWPNINNAFDDNARAIDEIFEDALDEIQAAFDE